MSKISVLPECAICHSNDGLCDGSWYDCIEHWTLHDRPTELVIEQYGNLLKEANEKIEALEMQLETKD